MNETIKHTLDGAAIITAIGTIASWLPPIAALFSIVWLGMQIYDRHQANKGKKNADKRINKLDS